MSAQILPFLNELQQNNDRVWFGENKDRFDIILKEFKDIVQNLIEHISLFDPLVAGLESKDCIYRIYRDIRFSPDKSPYKNHLGAYISKGGRKSEYAGYYIHLQPGSSFFRRIMETRT